MKKPPPPPDTPGTFCPNCGQTRTQPKDGDPKYPNMYPATEPDPHTDPFDCIRYLRGELSDLIRDLRKQHEV